MAGYNANLFNIPQPRDKPAQEVPDQRVVLLPLNLIALIISHLDNVGDLARICQTSRVLHYMTLPQLYKNITLTSYDKIRYKDDRAEGCGSASPFSMGLNALVTRSVANLVRSLTLQGQWKEHDLREFSQVGRVPDDAMMLNIAVRAAVDRCPGLESFKWDLNTKLLSNVYAGLSVLPRLQSLHIRFPSSRSPRPVCVIPAMPQLHSLTVTHIDPLCYPDDISTLICASKNLDALKLHWSPRMRDAGEPSVQLQSYFRQNIAAKVPLRIKHLGFYNLLALATPELDDVVQHSMVESFTMLNCFGTDEGIAVESAASSGSGLSAFLDGSWNRPPKQLNMFKTVRHDRLNREFARLLGRLHNLEKLYLISARHVPHSPNGHHQSDPSPTSASSMTPPNFTPNSGRTTPSLSNTSLRDVFIDVIVSNHGSTLRHLVLPDRWPLPPPVIARLFRACPNITQLAMALDFSSFEGIRLLLPFLKKLRAIRILVPTTGKEVDEGTFRNVVESDDEVHYKHMGRELVGEEFPHLRYVGMGYKAFEIGGHYEEKVVNEEGVEETVLRRRSKRVELDVVKDIEIWKMDSLDVI